MCVCVFCLYIRFLELNRGHEPLLALLGDRSSYSYVLIDGSTNRAKVTKRVTLVKPIVPIV